jgi:EAL domain-containing protein (putative c-di-GMP-specific phosphodiesterase class I)
LRAALAPSQFVLYYQPVVSIESGKLSGVEALIRWQHPTRGVVAPSEFIKLAEATGLIVPIGRWVLETACVQMEEWHRSFPAVPMTVSVNLSPTQLFQADLLESVGRALDRSGLDGGSLILELTEEVLLKETELAADRLEELKSLGVQLAIDDFGTGYSSLSYLRHLPFDSLKIDKSFIDGVTEGSAEADLAKAIVNLSRTLKLRTVAEGVELTEQLTVLRDLKCDQGQGYLFMKPAPAADIGALLASGRSVNDEGKWRAAVAKRSTARTIGAI